jgi:hypothetical protein
LFNQKFQQSTGFIFGGDNSTYSELDAESQNRQVMRRIQKTSERATLKDYGKQTTRGKGSESEQK